MQIFQIIFFFLIVIPSAIIHEYAHGWAADELGDPTARNAGRLTLDPRAHIDMWGTIIMPLIFIILPGSFMFAYAKPVPYNPYNLRNGKFGPALVAIAGPAANFFLALMFALLVRFVPQDLLGANFIGLLAIIVYANVLLGIFNLVPIPPLDGSKILFAFLPDAHWKLRESFERNGLLILMIFLFFGFSLISPIIFGMSHLLLGNEGMISLAQVLSGK